MKHILGLLCLILVIISVLPAGAQAEQCVEVWDNSAPQYEVNLDTGEVSIYAPIVATATATANLAAPYRLDITPRTSPPYTSTLTLTDDVSGIILVLADVIAGGQVDWSPDQRWIAYVELDITQSPPVASLTLYQFQTGEKVSTLLEGVYQDGIGMPIEWSPEGHYISISSLTDNLHAQVWVYSVPDMTLLNTRLSDTDRWPYVVWSPSENYMLIRGFVVGGSSVELMNVTSGEMYPVDNDLVGMPSGYFWSPDETFLAVSNWVSQTYHHLDVTNMQGEIVLDYAIINTSNQRTPLWLKNHQLLAQTDEYEDDLERGSIDPVYDLTVFDFETGTQYLLAERVYHYSLSEDARYLAGASHRSNSIQFADLSSDPPVVLERLTTDVQPLDVLWRNDRLELIVMFEDRSLRGYDFAAGEWRTIATLPASKSMLLPVPCSQ